MKKNNNNNTPGRKTFLEGLHTITPRVQSTNVTWSNGYSVSIIPNLGTQQQWTFIQETLIQPLPQSPHYRAFQDALSQFTKRTNDPHPYEFLQMLIEAEKSLLWWSNKVPNSNNMLRLPLLKSVRELLKQFCMGSYKENPAACQKINERLGSFLQACNRGVTLDAECSDLTLDLQAHINLAFNVTVDTKNRQAISPNHLNHSHSGDKETEFCEISQKVDAIFHYLYQELSAEERQIHQQKILDKDGLHIFNFLGAHWQAIIEGDLSETTCLTMLISQQDSYGYSWLHAIVARNEISLLKKLLVHSQMAGVSPAQLKDQHGKTLCQSMLDKRILHLMPLLVLRRQELNENIIDTALDRALNDVESFNYFRPLARLIVTGAIALYDPQVWQLSLRFTKFYQKLEHFCQDLKRECLLADLNNQEAGMTRLEPMSI